MQREVFVDVRREGRVERVRVGLAVDVPGGFSLQLGELTIAGASQSGAPSQSAAKPSSSGAPTVLPNYGRSKGRPIAGATREDLEYYAKGAKRSLADPTKARWHESEAALLAAIEAELARSGSQAPAPSQEQRGIEWERRPGPSDPPAPGDDDIPF